MEVVCVHNRWKTSSGHFWHQGQGTTKTLSIRMMDTFLTLLPVHGQVKLPCKVKSLQTQKTTSTDITQPHLTFHVSQERARNCSPCGTKRKRHQQPLSLWMCCQGFKREQGIAAHVEQKGKGTNNHYHYGCAVRDSPLKAAQGTMARTTMSTTMTAAATITTTTKTAVRNCGHIDQGLIKHDLIKALPH